MLSFLIFFVLNALPLSGERKAPEPLVIEGSTMGTTYRIVYFDPPLERDFSRGVDSVLAQVNKSINTYDPKAEISRFNRSEKGICLELPHLYSILKKARRIYRASGGAFDPTVMPLVNAYGFGPGEASSPTKQEVDSLLTFVGFDNIGFSKKRVWKKQPGIALDMGGIGQGFGADIIFGFLRSRGIENMLVELGGEGLSLGRNLAKDKPWTIGILDPNSTPDHQFFKAYVKLADRAFTTSGNYFNYRIIGGRKYGHTIDPVSGYPVQHSLLSASVFARDCTTADGWATAFMVMGTEKAIARARTLKNIDVLFLYSNEQGGLSAFVSDGLKEYITLEK